MKSLLLLQLFGMFLTLHVCADVAIDDDVFGRSLGGWAKRDKGTAEYPLSGSTYRTYKPEISPTPDGGIFVSVRIDNVRGWLASDDHAVLEITISPIGSIASAQSSIAIQGKSIKSDMILGGNEGGKAILSTEGAVRVGTDLVADLTAKLLRENIVEAGRVSFPAVLRHNYNRLFQAIRVDGAPVVIANSAPAAKPEPPAAPTPTKETADVGDSPKVDEPAETEESPDTEEVPPVAIPVPIPDAVPLQVKPFK